MKNLSCFNTRIIIGRTWHNFQVICNANQILLCVLLSRLNSYTASWEEHGHDIPSTAILTSNAQLTPWVLQLWKLVFDRGFEGFEPWVSWQLPTNCFNSSLNDSTLSLPSLTDHYQLSLRRSNIEELLSNFVDFKTWSILIQWYPMHRLN